MNTRLLIPCLLALPAVAACDGWNHVETGAYGQIEFTPDACGRSTCDLADALAVGGQALVSFDAVDDAFAVDDLVLISSNPGVVDVFLQPDGFDPTYRFIARRPGRASLLVIDRHGYEVDYTTVDVNVAARLAVRHQSGEARGPFASADDIDERWVVPVGQRAAFEIIAVDRYGEQLMGELRYQVEIDQPLFDAMAPDAALDAGSLRFSAPAGAHTVDFTAPDGSCLRVGFVGE
jgi:hypothetical protein